MDQTPKSSGKWKILLLLLLLLLFIGAAIAWWAVFSPNTRNTVKVYFTIPTGSDFATVADKLEEEDILRNRFTFEKLAEYADYPDNVKPGRYEIGPGLSNKELIRLLRSGKQSQVKLVIRSSWSKEALIGYVSENIEADSMFLVNMLNDTAFLSPYGYTPETVTALFIPNTYFFYWNTGAEKFFKRMVSESKTFWNQARRDKAAAIGLDKAEVITLASIVEKETNKTDEMKAIAGVYLNRLKKGMALQADPTVKFAVGDPGLKRIKSMHLQVESPYNTYRYAGLPPGPICLPSIHAIDAVLDYQKHKYYYFCAKEDLSGYHNFTDSYQQHLRNRDKYVLAIEKLGIN